MVLAVKILISFGRVSSNFIRYFKVKIILELFQHLVDQLLKLRIHHLGTNGIVGCLAEKLSPQTGWSIQVRSIISSIGCKDSNLPLAFILIVLDPFVLFNSIH